MTAPRLPGRANPLFRLSMLSQVLDSLLVRELRAAGVADGFGLYSAIGVLGRVTRLSVD